MADYMYARSSVSAGAPAGDGAKWLLRAALAPRSQQLGRTKAQLSSRWADGTADSLQSAKHLLEIKAPLFTTEHILFNWALVCVCVCLFVHLSVSVCYMKKKKK